MITDNDTNFVYLADSLKTKHPLFFKKFTQLLKDEKIRYDLLSPTKDIWAVDYMPIQISENKYIQFVYQPDYLQSKTWQKSISDVDSICKNLNLTITKSDIVLDGGNICKTKDKIIMCDKVFYANPHYRRKELINKLKVLFEVDLLYFVPQHPGDFTGHSDGMIRFLNEQTVLINDLTKEKKEFTRAFKIALDNAQLEYIEIPYNPYSNKNLSQANGCYINFLELNNTVIVPTFGINEDETAVKKFENLFKDKNVSSIESNEVAGNGGILNCITWNIKK
jgi:agmatine deiminase